MLRAPDNELTVLVDNAPDLDKQLKDAIRLVTELFQRKTGIRLFVSICNGSPELESVGVGWIGLRDKHGNGAYIDFRFDKLRWVGASKNKEPMKTIWSTDAA